jgi:hypothetical protein
MSIIKFILCAPLLLAGPVGWFTPIIDIEPHKVSTSTSQNLTLEEDFGTVQKSETLHAVDGVAILSDMPSDEENDDAGTSGILTRMGWEQHVGNGRGVWVSVLRQRLYIIDNYEILWQGPCATARAGTGSLSGSNQTPLGWHRIAQKIGEDAPWGQVFRGRVPSQEIWAPGDTTTEDLVLTRLLWLDGLEDGLNRGTNAEGTLVDSKKRYIYIHGTNDEQHIGSPSSHGCIRLLNNDVLRVFDLLPELTPLVITAE